MSYSHDHGQDYLPSASVIEITVRDIDRHESAVFLLGLVGSGSDATLLPLEAINSIEAQHIDAQQIRGEINTPATVNVFLVKIEVGEYVILAIQVVASKDLPEPLIGRDVLNYLTTTLNGSASIIEISD
jgi:predicted aspartyl protease